MFGEPPSTWYTDAPHWQWLIIAYFFIGGIAGGAFFLAALMDLFGRPEDRPLARLGYYIAFPAVVLCGILLIVDLARPLRFWHMLLQSNTGMPMFKWYSPMSFGAWALLVFGALSFVAFLAALGDTGHRRWHWTRAFRPPGIVGVLVAVIGAILGLFVAGYTGILLAVTNRHIWADTTLIGLTFVISGASTAAAVLILLAWRRRTLAGGIQALKRFDAIALVLELVAIAALAASLGAAARGWFNAWGLVLVLGVVGLGIVAPLILHLRSDARRLTYAVPVAAVLVLIGGFLLRLVLLLSSEYTGVRV
jgi:protein NrfD